MNIPRQAFWLAPLALLALSGCGGGGDGETASANPPPPPPAGGNAPPTIQGQPSTSVTAGQAFSFQPTASDPNGDSLTFSVTNLPGWASFNASTGRISGTPDDGDVATYSGITVSVSDGQASASIPAFTITVLQASSGSGSATLSWTPPTANEDGSSLTDLAGYVIVYGLSESNMGQSVELTNPSLNRYVVENLSSGTWFFALRSVNRQGVTSQLSGVASKTIS